MKKGLKMKEEYKILNDMGYSNDKIDTLLSLGYTIKDILKINRKTNIIATYSNKSIIDKFNYLLSLGFFLFSLTNSTSNPHFFIKLWSLKTISC